jgi:hypothetical protein
VEAHLVAVVVLPLWLANQIDPATLRVFYSCLVVLIVARRHSLALRDHALRHEAGRSVALGSYSGSQ